MDADLIQLARQLAAHPKWEWREGMRATNGQRAIFRSPGVGGVLPDLRDAATAGCLLAMLPADVNVAQHNGARWWVGVYASPSAPDRSTATGSGSCLGEAAARALLACWGSE